jgi:spore germination protein GerM
MAHGKRTNKKKGRPAPAKRKKAAPRASDRRNLQTRSSPLMLLIIMGLIAVIVILGNHILSERTGRGAKRGDVLHERAKPSARSKPDEIKENGSTSQVTREESSGDLGPARQVSIYLVRVNEHNEVSLSSVRRTVRGDNPLRSALEELIRGPSPSERKRGLLSAVPADLRIRGINISKNIATIDFNTALEQGGTGVILMNRLDQLVYTATQFEGISGISIRINGQKKKFLGADGLSIAGPLTRR